MEKIKNVYSATSFIAVLFSALFSQKADMGNKVSQLFEDSNKLSKSGAAFLVR
jgi:hypothetical protein